MALNRNQETFDTYMHRRVWGQGTSLIPIEKTLPYVDEEYKNSCIHLHNFYSSVFEDMYENIELYGLLPNGIPELTDEAVLLKKKPEQPFWFFMKLAEYSEINENGNMALSTAIYNKKFTKYLKENSFLIDLLSKHGLVISSFPDVTTISNSKYPDMFRIVLYMTDNSKTKYNLMACDFRVFNKVKFDGFELVTETLGDTQQRIAVGIDEFLHSKDVKREKNLTIGRVIYRYNKEIIAYLYRENNQLVVPVIFLDYRNYMSFDELISKIDIYENSDELKEYAFYNQKECTYCPNLNCDFYIKYKKEKLKVCRHRGGVYFREFNERNIAYLKQFIDIKINSSNTAL